MPLELQLNALATSYLITKKTTTTCLYNIFFFLFMVLPIKL